MREEAEKPSKWQWVTLQINNGWKPLPPRLEGKKKGAGCVIAARHEVGAKTVKWELGPQRSPSAARDAWVKGAEISWSPSLSSAQSSVPSTGWIRQEISSQGSVGNERLRDYSIWDTKQYWIWMKTNSGPASSSFLLLSSHSDCFAYIWITYYNVMFLSNMRQSSIIQTEMLLPFLQHHIPITPRIYRKFLVLPIRSRCLSSWGLVTYELKL